jgi:2-succinyl-6-hydroxy-2,4-cyclohexadiene-1-carboxylate synthase
VPQARHGRALTLSPPLVLLHGFWGCGADWEALRAALPSGQSVWAPDLPGHGAVPQPVADFEQTVHLLAAQIAARYAQPVHLAGYSLGGRLALALALRHPQQVSRLFLLAAGAGLVTAEQRAERRHWEEHWAQRLEQQPLAQTLAAWYQQPLFERLSTHPAFAAMRQRRLQADPHQLATAMRVWGSSQQPNFWPELPTLQPPLHYLCGGADTRYCMLGAQICERVPGAQFTILPGVGHSLPLEAPQACAVALAEPGAIPNA